MKIRLPLIGLLLACLSSFLHATGGHKSFEVYDFSKGQDVYHAPAVLPDGFVQDSLNVLFDDVAPGTKRAGYTVAWSTKSYSFTGLWTYTDSTNTTWQIARSSDQLTASNLAGTNIKISTVSANDTVGEVSAFGYAYFVDPSQGVYYWNGTSTTYVSGSPKGSIIAQFHQRLWVTGAAVPNGNQLYGSKYYDGTTWTTGLNAIDPVQYSIGLNDNFDTTTAEYVYLDTLYLFKHYSIFALYGFDQTNFQISQLTQECGCIDGNTIQTYNGGLKLVSLRGVENFDGYRCTRISDSMKTKVDPAIQASGLSGQSWLQQTSADWSAGTINPSISLSTSTNPPALALPNGSRTDSTSSAFSQGTLQNITTSGNQYSIGSDPGFETSPPASLFSSKWTNTSNFLSTNSEPNSFGCAVSPQAGSWFARTTGIVAPVVAKIIKASDSSVLFSKNIGSCSVGTCSWVSDSLSSSGITGNDVKVQFTSGGGSLITTSSFTLTGDVSYYAICSCSSGGCSGGTIGSPGGVVGLDSLSGGGIDTASFTSKVLDTGVNNPLILPQAVWSNNTTTPTFRVQVSSSSSGAWSNLSPSTGTALVGKEFIRYVSSFSLLTSDVSNSNVSSVTLNWSSDSGTWTSPSHATTGISSFGNFSVTQDLSAGGAIAFAICTSSSSTMIPKVCTAQTPNAQITSSTNSFAQVISTFTVSAATQSATLNNFTVNWFTGNRAIPMASTVWDNRYWLSLTTNTVDTNNDAVLVLNSRGAWTTFDIKAGAFTQYKNGLYHADATGTGQVYLDNQGYADNGAAINAYIKTKDLSLGGLSSEDYLYVIYPAALNTGNCAMSVQYDMDHSGSPMSLGSPLLSEFDTMASVRLPFPIDTTHQDFGQSINFTVGTNDSSCAWNFYGLSGLYKQRPLQ